MQTGMGANLSHIGVHPTTGHKVPLPRHQAWCLTQHSPTRHTAMTAFHYRLQAQGPQAPHRHPDCIFPNMFHPCLRGNDLSIPRQGVTDRVTGQGQGFPINSLYHKPRRPALTIARFTISSLPLLRITEDTRIPDHRR